MSTSHTSTSSPLMRAVIQQSFGTADVLEVAQLPRPVPIPTEILVRVHAAGVNPVDWKSRASGGMAGVLGAPPFVLGWDVSGVVEEVGFGVTTFSVGDEVYGMPWFPRQAGAYADFVTAPARQFARKPRTLTHLEAAAVPLAALTAWQVLVDTANVQNGERVLIHAAAGGVGHFAVQIAKHLGATVIGTASARHHEWLRKLGADQLIDYTASRFDEMVADVDVVVDMIGNAHDTSMRSLSVLRAGGLLVAVPGGVSPALAAAAHDRGVRTSPFLVEPDGVGLRAIAEIIDQGEMSVELQNVFPMERVADAHRVGETDRTRGKIVLDMTT